jgi:hypothetical protein
MYVYCVFIFSLVSLLRMLIFFFSYLFRSEWKWIIYFPSIYVYCIYRGTSKAPKQLSNCLKRAETSVVLFVFDCVLGEVRAYNLISINAVTVWYRRSTWIRYLGLWGFWHTTIDTIYVYWRKIYNLFPLAAKQVRKTRQNSYI